MLNAFNTRVFACVLVRRNRRFFSSRRVTIEFVNIPPTSVDIVAIRRKPAKEKMWLNSKNVGRPKERYRGIQSGKSQADRALARARAEGLRNGRSGFMAALNPNEHS